MIKDFVRIMKNYFLPAPAEVVLDSCCGKIEKTSFMNLQPYTFAEQHLGDSFWSSQHSE